MPLTEYSSSQKATLNAFNKITNFRASNFTFYNKKTGVVIPDAIRLDQNGKLIIKDKQVEVIITDLIGRKKYITEVQDDNGNDILYFEDEENERISIGQMYYNIQRFLNNNLEFWYNERAERNISGNLDRFIIEDIFDSFKELNINDESIIKDYVTQEYDYWKNKWHDIPCIEVETPSYTSGKFANISAKVVMKIRCDKPLYTGFRIYDATTGFELSRTIHASKGQHGKDVTYTIPLSYQGPLPDTEFPTENPPAVLTYKDIANIDIDGDNGRFLTTPLDQSLTVRGVPGSKHVIKVQWITCDYASEVMPDGEVLESLTREFDPSGTTSLDVTVYSKTSANLETAELNGSLNMDDVEGSEYYFEFETKPYGISNGYSLALSANKNINVSVLGKSLKGFSIKVNRKVAGIKIDWLITYYVDKSNIEDVLNDENRGLNHHLFKKRDEVLDFCQELIKPGVLPAIPGGPSDVIDECECCDCCTDDDVDVVYKVVEAGAPPTCSASAILLGASENPGGIIGYLQYASANGLMTSGQVAAYDQYFNDGELCGDITVPYKYTLDDFGDNSYSLNLDKKFLFLAEIVVSPGTPDPLVGGGGGGDLTTSYDFFEDLYSNKGLARVVTVLSGSAPETIIKNINDRPLFYQAFEHCSYSFEENAIVTTKVVEEEEESTVYKMLKSDVSVTCDEIDEEEVIEEIVDPIDDAVFEVVEGQDINSGESDYISSFNSLFSQDLFFNGLDNSSLNNLEANMKTINDAKKKGLLKLEHDRVRNINDLPVQLLANNVLRLDFPRNSIFENYFASTSSDVLYSSNGSLAKTRINPHPGFLSIKAFRHNLIAFDPNPGIVFTEETNPFFPTFNPIYNQKSFDQLLEYIYTAIYPTNIVPLFPNFRVGDFVINGALYNPLYDLRNYRTFGFYQSFVNDNNQQLFISDPISLYLPQIKIGRFINIGDNYYQVKRDLNNTGTIFTNITSDGVVQKVKPSGIIFKPITESLYNLNPSLQVTL